MHFQGNALAHAGRSGRRVVSAFIATAFAQHDADAARQQWRRVADQLRPKVPKLAALMDESEADVLAYMTFPLQHRAKLHSTDVMDKRLDLGSVLFSGCTGDLVAKSGVRLQAPPGCPSRPADLRRPCTFTSRRSRAPLAGAYSVYAYTRDVDAHGPEAGTDVRARMFTGRLTEDPATGSATAAMTALVADLSGAPELRPRVGQGEDMGRPSLMHVGAKREGSSVMTFVRGHCVEVMEGTITLGGSKAALLA